MPTPSTCWPGDDLDGYKEFSPDPLFLRMHWDAKVIDISGIPSRRILRTTDPFDVRFRVEFSGPAWQCMAGDWKFDLYFDEQGATNNFKLSGKLPADALTVKDWKGCNGHCLELLYQVPAGTIAEGVYLITGEFRVFCCGKPAAIVGFDPLGEYQWYTP